MTTLARKERLEALLHGAGVQFEAHTHSPAYTAQEVAEVEHVPGITVAKVVMVMAEGELAMMVLPAPYRLDTKKTAAVLGVKDVRLATEDEFSPAFPGLDVGAMPPFGDFCNVPTYVDESLAKDDYIVFQAATHTDAIRMKYADYATVAKPIIVDIAVRR